MRAPQSQQGAILDRLIRQVVVHGAEVLHGRAQRGFAERARVATSGPRWRPRSSRRGRGRGWRAPQKQRRILISILSCPRHTRVGSVFFFLTVRNSVRERPQNCCPSTRSDTPAQSWLNLHMKKCSARAKSPTKAPRTVHPRAAQTTRVPHIKSKHASLRTPVGLRRRCLRCAGTLSHARAIVCAPARIYSFVFCARQAS
jgi:hypothetical protein